MALTFGICLLGIGRAVLWQDELATVSAGTRSLPDLARLCAHVDGVLAAYYVLVHVWVSAFGASPVSVRLPSALAMSAAAGVTAVLGARPFDRRAGLLAGLVLAGLPAASWVGQEARPSAITFLLVAVSTLLLVRAVDRPVTRRWALYGLAIVALGTMQLTTTVLVLAHVPTDKKIRFRIGLDAYLPPAARPAHPHASGSAASAPAPTHRRPSGRRRSKR